jgi:hypothetical protein
MAGRQILVMLHAFSLIACAAAPFLSNTSTATKLGLAFLGLCAFLLSLIASWALILVIHGIPVG